MSVLDDSLSSPNSAFSTSGRTLKRGLDFVFLKSLLRFSWIRLFSFRLYS